MSKFLGDLFEERVVNYLLKKGFKVLSRNYRSRFGEIDIIAQKSSKLAVIEVKGGKSWKNLPYRVDCNKLKRVFLTFQRWLGENSNYERFEVVFLTALVFEGKISFKRVYLEDCSEYWEI